jgi:hypothetical protein
MRYLVGTSLLALLTATELRAETARPPGAGFVLRLGAGPGFGRASIGSANESKAGVAGGVTIGAAGRRFELDLETAFQPFTTPNPVADEGFKAVYFLPSLRFHGDHLYARVGIGYARYSWSGPQATVSSDGSVALAAAIGYEFATPRSFPLAVEAYYRVGSPDLEITCAIAGVQVVGSWYSKKPR